MFIQLWFVITIISFAGLGLMLAIIADCCDPEVNTPFELICRIICRFFYLFSLWYDFTSRSFKLIVRYLAVNDAERRGRVLIEYPKQTWINMCNEQRNDDTPEK